MLLAADMLVRLEFVDHDSATPVDSLVVGDDFDLNVYVQDNRGTSAEGVFRAYFDFAYTKTLAEGIGDISPGSEYAALTSGEINQSTGRIDDAGGVDTNQIAPASEIPPVSPEAEFLLFTAPFQALSTGTLTFLPAAASTSIRLFPFETVQLNNIDFEGTSIDIVSAGIRVTQPSTPTTTEAGDTTTFDVVLTKAPESNVTVTVHSDDTTEGTVFPTSLTFTPANWDTSREVTVTGQDDAVDDGDVAYTIVTEVESDDSDFGDLNPDDVPLTNLNDDTAGVTASPTSGLETTEAGDTATFTIVLDSEPLEDVSIDLTSSNTDEGTVPSESFLFTPDNWGTAQTVTVTGQNDAIDDGDFAYTIEMSATSIDPKYNGIPVSDVAVVNRDDDDTAGVTVSPTSGLETTEGGDTDTFTVVLDSEPLAEVTIGLTSSNTSEGTVSAASLLFMPENWDTAQPVTVTGLNDAIDDDDFAYTIDTTATSSDPKYNGISVADVGVVNLDDDVAGITVSPTTGLETTEAGDTDTFTVVLRSEPTENVTIGLTSSNTDEGTVSSGSLLFTPDNWDTAQTVTVIGQNDAVDDGDVAYTIGISATSSDLKYNGLPVSNVSLTNLNDDAAGITVSPLSGLETTEAGDTDTFTVVLRSEPTENVTIGLTSSNTDEGTVSAGSLLFTPDNWDTAQTVTVTGQNDAIDDGDFAYTIGISATSSDLKYNGIPVSDVSLTNLNDDTAGVTVSPTSGLETTEGGDTDTFTIVLRSEPTENVTIGLTSGNTDRRNDVRGKACCLRRIIGIRRRL